MRNDHVRFCLVNHWRSTRSRFLLESVSFVMTFGRLLMLG